MLCSIENVQAVPGMNIHPVAFLNMLIGAADSSLKAYCKQNLEVEAYEEYYDGQGTQDIALRQMPVWCGRTTIAAVSNGQVLPHSTISVASVKNFHPGLGGDPNATPPTISIQTGISTWTIVTYTGTLPNQANPSAAPAFTGCSGGSGTLSSTQGTNAVASPVVYWDPQGQYGQRVPGTTGEAPFGEKTILHIGNGFEVVLDRPGYQGRTISRRGILRRSGWLPGAFISSYSALADTGGKLAATLRPGWPIGQGTIKVLYTAGYFPVPFDLQYAATMLVVNMVRIMPNGTEMSSESLGAYSYSALADGDNPGLGSLRRTLARYRETSFTGGW